MGIENIDDELLLFEDAMGQHLSTIDDRAMKRQNQTIKNSRRFIAE